MRSTLIWRTIADVDVYTAAPQTTHSVVTHIVVDPQQSLIVQERTISRRIVAGWYYTINRVGTLQYVFLLNTSVTFRIRISCHFTFDFALYVEELQDFFWCNGFNIVISTFQFCNHIIKIHLDEPRFSELNSCRLYCELPHLNLDITLVRFGVFPSPAFANIFDLSIMMDFMEHVIILRKQHVKRQTAGSETDVMQSKSRCYTECLQQWWSTVLRMEREQHNRRLSTV